jgi:hypothetical protein
MCFVVESSFVVDLFPINHKFTKKVYTTNIVNHPHFAQSHQEWIRGFLMERPSTTLVFLAAHIWFGNFTQEAVGVWMKSSKLLTNQHTILEISEFLQHLTKLFREGGFHTYIPSFIVEWKHLWETETTKRAMGKLGTLRPFTCFVPLYVRIVVVVAHQLGVPLEEFPKEFVPAKPPVFSAVCDPKRALMWITHLPKRLPPNQWDVYDRFMEEVEGADQTTREPLHLLVSLFFREQKNQWPAFWKNKMGGISVETLWLWLEHHHPPNFTIQDAMCLVQAHLGSAP